jgi:hypothetical protein
MTTTLGQLVSELYDMFERRYRDPELARMATHVVVNDVLSKPKRKVARTSRATISPRARTSARALKKAA